MVIAHSCCVDAKTWNADVSSLIWFSFRTTKKTQIRLLNKIDLIWGINWTRKISIHWYHNRSTHVYANCSTRNAHVLQMFKMSFKRFPKRWQHSILDVVLFAYVHYDWCNFRIVVLKGENLFQFKNQNWNLKNVSFVYLWYRWKQVMSNLVVQRTGHKCCKPRSMSIVHRRFDLQNSPFTRKNRC